MTGWLKNLDINSRRVSLNEASRLTGISAKAIEKDWWVTLCLKVIFSSRYANYCTFKGGTSLSKGWSIIDRFSEDIDVALDAGAFGISYIENPSKNFVEKLRRVGSAFTRHELKDALKERFESLHVPSEMYTVEVGDIRSDMPDTDPQAIYINYVSLFDPNPYLPDSVKIEFSVRTKGEPNEKRMIASLLNKYFSSQIYEEEVFPVSTIQPSRTLIEKILLLHEEYNRDDRSKMRTHRMSRHYYDLYQIIKIPEYYDVLKQKGFIQDVIKHRKSYSRLRHFNYESLQVGRISLIPSPEIIIDLQSDYEQMNKEMIYGDAPPFNEILKVVAEIENRFNRSS